MKVRHFPRKKLLRRKLTDRRFDVEDHLVCVTLVSKTRRDRRASLRQLITCSSKSVKTYTVILVYQRKLVTFKVYFVNTVTN